MAETEHFCFFTRLTQIWLGLYIMYVTSSVGQESTTFGLTTTLSSDMTEHCLYIRTCDDGDDDEASTLWFDGCCLRCDCSDECSMKGNCCPGKIHREHLGTEMRMCTHLSTLCQICLTYNAIIKTHRTFLDCLTFLCVMRTYFF